MSVCRLRRRAAWYGGCLLLISSTFVFSSGAEAAPLGFNTALELAERQSPRLSASAAQIDAARLLVAPASALPDPKAFVGIDNYPVSGPDSDHLKRDSMTMQKVGVMQEITNSDKRHAREAVAVADVDAANAQQQIDRLTLRRDTAIAWLDLYYLQRKSVLFNELEHENILLNQIIQSQVSGGRAQAADAVAVKQEAAELADRRDDLVRDLVRARSQLQQLVGSSVDDGLAGAPPVFHIDGTQLRDHLHHHPELLAFAAETRKAEAEVAEARAMKKPDWDVELAYQQRAPEYGDMVSLQFTFDLPVSPSTRQNPVIAARERELARIDAQRESMLRDHTVELDSMLAEHAALVRQWERAKQTVSPLVEQKVSLQTASYQAGTGSLDTVLTARRERIEQRLRVIELEKEQVRTAAQLFFAYGENEQ